MQNVKTTIPVYDICSLSGNDNRSDVIIAQPFAQYLEGHPNLHRAHRHSFYHIVLFTAGAGSHTIDFEKFPVQAGQVYFMVPGQVHSWNFKGDVEGYIINFSGEIFSALVSKGQYLEQFPFFMGAAKDSVIKLKGSALGEAERICRQIVSEVGRVDAFTQDMIRALLVCLFITVTRITPVKLPLKGMKHNMLILHNFRKMVDTFYAEKRLPKEYAAMLYITPNHLNALCNDLLGKPAGEVIRDRILLEAKRLLTNADHSIREIAAQLNFADNSNFTKFFKKYTSLTPEEFRRSAESIQ